MAGGPKNSSPWIDSVPDVGRFPRLEGEVQCDVVVVGAGISGVMSAYHLARKGLSVVLLEKNRVASGDTGFTTGFLLRAPDTSIAKLTELYGERFVKDLFEAAGKAQETVRGLVSRGKIDCGFSDCSAYYCAYRKGDAALASEWKAISKADSRASFVRGKELAGLGISIAEAIRFSGEAQFNPRKFIFGLLALPESKGIRVFEDSEVLDVTVGERVVASTAGGKAVCGKIVVCSGLPIAAFSELRAAFEPKVTYALAARFGKAPISADLFWDTYDPYFYYRRLDERTVIIGGADRRPGEKPAPEEQKPHDKLRSFVAERMGGEFEVTNEWSGTLYESPDGLPFASEHPHYRGKVFVGSCCGFGGNGLVLGTLAGSVLADLVSGAENPYAKLLSFSRTKVEIKKPVPRPQAGGLRSRITVKIKDVEEGYPYCADAGGRKIAVFRAGDGFYAIDDTCTHAGGSLSEGTQEGGVVTCPMHGARFDIKTGTVLGPPASRPVRSYPAKAAGENVEVEIGAEGAKPAGKTQPANEKGAGPQAPAAPQKAASAPQGGPKLFDGVRKNPWYVIKASAIALAFWLVQFLYMYFSAVPGQLERAIILASSYSGATLIGLALMLGPIAVLFPKYNQVGHRRTFGVWGFTFIISHVIWVFIYYQFTLQSFLSNLDPFQNAIIFGALAFACYVPMYLTSTDWAVARLGFRRWKTIHRIVYLAFLFSSLHFIRIVSLNANPLIWNYSKALLMAVTAVAYALELAAYAKYMRRKRTWGNTLYGGALIIFGILMMYLAFQP